MDDQNKKNGYDDFFRNREEGQDSAENLDKSKDVSASSEPAEGSSKTSYYYSYGPFRPQDDSSQAQPADRSASESAKPQESYSPYASSTSDAASDYTSASGVTDSNDGAGAGQVEATPPPALRTFQPNQQAARAGWQVNEPKRRTSFRAMFLSFLAGVLVVGGLMYTSDSQNWFSQGKETLASGQSNSHSSTGSNSNVSGTTAAAAAARPDNIAKLFETASPAVVKIETFVKPSTRSNGGSILDDPFFRQFFGDDYPGTQQQPDNGSDDNLQASGIGTGFFFDSTGYILTNQHVVGSSDKIEVTVQGYDKPFTAELLGSDYQLDLAVLKVTGDKAFPTLPLGSSENINIGDWVVAIGNPYGFDHTVTVGVLSAKERPIDIQDEEGTRNYEHLLQTDASINPGNSGGPLLNVKGEVIGINTAVSSQAQGIGFAIPTTTINNVLETLKNNQEVPKEPLPFIGAELGDVTSEIAAQLGIEKAEGSIVRNVYYNSPAYLGDLKQYDVIVGIDGKKSASTAALIKSIQSKKVGDKIELNVIRRGESINLSVEIGDKNKFNAE
ncbi:S1C family serine protease [Paenibacillus sp. NEAU-GSW1]|uniref:S1C family serine protease n=1 Tax=Paenibacillus sp. NEAU-GSW1 TaxID=2682486 RepID=UPI0012E0ECA8|nr:trypsin-like peptidase domain-containing protein [Paenibacillus sp. NEAU-GSW1]MUT64366.1 trypsin-like serine protease [Paenibacillus sp. NEAU-GSW1]